MKKIKLDVWDLKMLVRGLLNSKENCCAENEEEIDLLIISLADKYEHLKPGRKKRFRFQPKERHLICRSLVDWRNQQIEAGDDVAVEIISEYLLMFAA